MASLQIREMPPILYESLKLRAEKDHRSMAQQAIVMLSEAMATGGRKSSRRIEALRKIRSDKIKTRFKDLNIAGLIQEDRRR